VSIVIAAATRRIVHSGVLIAAASTVLAGCFTSTADFKSDAEEFIAEQVPPAVEAEFTSVNCDAPVDQQIGTRFACQAIDTDGGVWEFDNVIDAENEFTVNISSRP
jgi:hypothetical protein